ncbi:MAG: hypothetical protein R3C12_11005 [Planctomycetaceae bacterium]|nr:hypothetical protein [Planctomycetaceae bacterium]
MSLRTLLPLEYRSDALMTMIRFLLCLLPCVMLWIVMLSTFPEIKMDVGGDSDLENQLVVSRIKILNTAWISGGVFLFVLVQMWSRASYLSSENNRELFLWQALHGWDGSARGAVYRPLVPLTEWGLLAVTCILTIHFTGEWWIRIPFAWVCARLLLLTWAYAGLLRETRRELFYGFAGAWFLVGAYCLAPNNLLGPLPLSLLIGLHLKLDSTMRRRQIQAWNEQSESLITQALKVHLRNRENKQRKFIAEFLSPKVRDWRPDWPTTLTGASVWAWLVCTVTWSLEANSQQYWSLEGNPDIGSPDWIHGLVMFITMSVYFIIFLRLLGIGHWQSRLGLLGRLRTGRLIVPSYDRIFLPILMNTGVLYIHLYLSDFVGVPPISLLGITQVVLVIVLLKAPPSDPSFQMTADAKLSKSSYQIN